MKNNFQMRRMIQNFYGRILHQNKTKRQLLSAHLQNVAWGALKFAQQAQPIRADEDQAMKQWKGKFHGTAYIAGLLHDLGKYRTEFQEYLLCQRKRSSETNHAAYGSAAAALQFGDDASAFAIGGHHAGLHDLSMLDDLVNGPKYSAYGKYSQLLALAQDETELGVFPEPNAFTMGDSDDGEKHRYEFAIRMLFSMVVDSDRLDAEQWETEQKTGKPWQRQGVKLDSTALLQRIQTVREQRERERPRDDLNRLRNRIFDSCVVKGKELPQGFFSLTVPTGGGKTLSSMAFALAHAEKHDLRRVVVVIPYLSIIEQNAKEYSDAFGDGIVLEHHSAVEIRSDAGRHDSAEPNEPTNASDLEKAMENWDMPVIVTTSVQFIESLFAASPGRARKLHNIARSVVIFDEVQTLPAHLLEPTLNVLRALKEHWGVSIVFCSATQPAFKKSAALKNGFEANEMIPIVSEPKRVFKSLRRVDYYIEPKENRIDWQVLAERMTSHPQALSVLNLRRQAFGLWEALHACLRETSRDDNLGAPLFHLSSAMCPAHRLDLLGLSKDPPLNNIRTRLSCGKPCWVASTQLVEAGVDVDFPIVFRAMGPLDSLVQAAGRCNREGLLRDEQGRLCRGQVVIFYPSDEGLPPGVYNRATNISPAYLDPQQLAEDPEIFARYFNELYQITPTDFARMGKHTIQEDRAGFRFRKVAEHARVITDATVSVIVPYGKGKGMVDEIRRKNDFDFKALRQLQRFMVSIRNQGPYSDFAKLKAIGAITPLLHERLEIPVLADWCYKTDPPLGVVIENRPMEDFVQ